MAFKIIDAVEKTANEVLKMKNLQKKDDKGNILEEAESVNNTISAIKSTINTYGIRQEIITQNSHEDAVITARRKLNDNCTPKEEIEVECLGDINYKVGYGVHVILPFLPQYEDCFMYIKEVTNEWKDNGTFISTLVLTPSRVMDEQEWQDAPNNEEDSEGAVDSETANKIIALLKQQVGKPYVWGGNTPDEGFDCSGLVQYCYNQFSDELTCGALGRRTYEQVKQGLEVDKDDKNDWQIGDLLFWKGKDTPPSHVSVYLGNNQMIHAPQTGDKVKIVDISRNDIYAVRRVIPEVVSIGSGSGLVTLPTDYQSALNYVASNCSTFISNMKKFEFKGAINSVSASKKVDAYLTAAIIAIESEGNPYCGGTYYGLMQVAGGVSDCKQNIEQGLNCYNESIPIVGEQLHVLLSAYNCGATFVKNAAIEAGISLNKCGVKEIGDALYNKSTRTSGYDPNEKKYYASKVLKAYSILKSKQVLN
jgi:cell wall-associated NlpC family hydrolase